MYVREKIRISIWKKLQTNIAIDLISEEDSIMLEAKLIEDMEEVIKGKMELSKTNLKPGEDLTLSDPGEFFVLFF